MKLFYALSLAALALVACDSQKTVAPADLPAEVTEFISTNFPQQTIVQAVKDVDGLDVDYDIILSDGYALTFDKNKQVEDIESTTPGMAVPSSALQPAVVEYVNQHFAGLSIVEWQLDDRKQEVKLNNGTELEFSRDGAFLRIEEMGHAVATPTEPKATDSITSATVATNSDIEAFVKQHFAQSAIASIHPDTDNGQTTYDVKLSTGEDLEFDQNFNLYEAQSASHTSALPASIVPQAIADYVKANYPNAFVVKWDKDNRHQEVELNNGVDLEFDLNGNFIRIDR